MRYIVRILQYMRLELWLAVLISAAALLFSYVRFQDAPSFGETISWMLTYFTFGNGFFSLFFLFIYLGFLGKFYVALVNIANDIIFEKKSPQKKAIQKLVRSLFEPIAILAPLAIVAGPAWRLLGNISYELRFTRYDEIFFSLDTILWKVPPFVSLPGLITGDIPVYTLYFSYIGLALVMSASAGILYIMEKVYLRQFIMGFLISLVIGYPFFYAFPCQGPGNYFLRNLRGHEFPVSIQQTLDTYQPSPLAYSLTDAMGRTQINEDADNAAPVSCFPSMHAVWGLFVVYFLARIRAWSLFITIPWFSLMLLGALYFAQHYAIDYLASVLVAGASIYVAHLLLRFEVSIKKRIQRMRF